MINNLNRADFKLNKDSVSLNSYNTMAAYYFNEVDSKPFNAYYERPATISLLPDVLHKHVLDAGCAAGWYTEWLLEHGAVVTAVDFSPNMIEMTKTRVGNKAVTFRADLNEPLSFLEDSTFDIVLSSLTLHYLKDWTTVLNEFNRILCHNGMLVFSVHHPFMDFAYFKRDNYFSTEILDDEWQTSEGPVKVQFFRRPLSSIISSLTGAGFVIENLLEPMPTEQFRVIQPNTYKRLTKFPQFLFISAKKR